MKVKVAKRVIISLLSTLLVALTFFTAIKMTSICQKTNDGIPAAATLDGGGYDFNDGVIKYETVDKNYKDNDEFYVDDLEGFNNFAISVAYGCTFEDKEVWLTASIEGGGQGIMPVGMSIDTKYHGVKPFKGKFFGQGNYINNVKTVITKDHVHDNEHLYVAIFSHIYDAEIHDLRIKNYTIDMGATMTYSSYGGLVALTSFNFIIRNCTVENFYLKMAVAGTAGYYGGLVGCVGRSNDGTNISISNCYINNFTLRINQWIQDNFFPDYVAIRGIITILSDYKGKTDITSCFVGDIEYYIPSIVTVDKQSFGCTETGSLYDPTDLNLNLPVGSRFTALDRSVWYVPNNEEYNKGYPYLRAFITFNRYIIAPDGANYSISFEVPDSLNYVQEITATRLNTFYIYGTTINIYPPVGYYLSSWQYGANYSPTDGMLQHVFTPQFSIITFVVTLANTTSAVEVSASPYTSIVVNYGQKVEIRQVYEKDINQFNVHVYVDNGWVAYWALPGTKYELKNPQVIEHVYSNVTLTPVMELKQYRVDYK